MRSLGLGVHLANSLQIHSVRAQYIGRVITGVVVKPDARCAVVLSASGDGSRMESVNRLMTMRRKRDMGPLAGDGGRRATTGMAYLRNRTPVAEASTAEGQP